MTLRLSVCINSCLVSLVLFEKRYILCVTLFFVLGFKSKIEHKSNQFRIFADKLEVENKETSQV